MNTRQKAAPYLNRELSWLDFNARVLEEALSKDNPLLERLRFLCIVASNFDEFFMVRVAAIKARVRAGDETKDLAGYTSKELLEALGKRSREIISRQYTCLTHDLLPALAQSGLLVIRPDEYSVQERRWLEDYFAGQVEPCLTPLAAPEEGAFLPTGNLRIHAAFLLSKPSESGESEERLAIVQVPQNLGRFVRLPAEDGERIKLALLDDLVLGFGHRLFLGCTVRERVLFKVTRDADIGVDEDRDDDFVAAMEEVLVNRQNSWPVRMTIASESGIQDGAINAMLAQAVGLAQDDVYLLDGPVDLRSFIELTELKDFSFLRYPEIGRASCRERV